MTRAQKIAYNLLHKVGSKGDGAVKPGDRVGLPLIMMFKLSILNFNMLWPGKMFFILLLVLNILFITISCFVVMNSLFIVIIVIVIIVVVVVVVVIYLKFSFNSQVALVYPNNEPISFIGAFYGCLTAGVVPVPIEVPLTKRVCCCCCCCCLLLLLLLMLLVVVWMRGFYLFC